jgi:murein DD-endopeptidase MepM/ murein hydrolase activator NlpD
MLLAKSVRPLGLLLILALLALAPIPAGAQTRREADEKEAEKERAYHDLLDANEAVGSAISELENIELELYDLERTIDRLETTIAAFEVRTEELRAIAREVVVEAYTSSGAGLVGAAFSAASIQDLITSQTLIDSAATRDLAALDLLTAVNRENDRLKLEVADKTVEVEALRVQQAEVVERLATARAEADAIFTKANAEYKDAYARYQAELRRLAELRRQRETGGGKGLPDDQTRGVVCPVVGPTWFTDTWGAPRAGGRTHKGVDMSAAYGTPLVAMNSGRVRLNWHSSGGRQVYITADDGNFYYYAHLSGYASGVSNGDRVKRGQRIGYVGSTGNAATAHLHLGLGLIGGPLVNPYPTVRRVC